MPPIRAMPDNKNITIIQHLLNLLPNYILMTRTSIGFRYNIVFQCIKDNNDNIFPSRCFKPR